MNSAIGPIRLAAVLLLGGMLAACAATAPSGALEEARASVENASSDPDVESFASVRLDEAKAALRRAEAAWQADEDEAEVEHLAYLARQRAAIARARADERKAQQQIAALGDERQEIQLEARTREVETARQAAAEAARQAEELQKQLEQLQAEQTERGLVLTLGDILFDVDRAELTPGGEQQVARVADFLREFPERDVLIEGHTDAMGEDEYNRQLSQRRAEAIEDFLISQGIDPRRIVSRGYGEQYPVASNESSAGRQQNRRVEIVILKEGKPLEVRPAAGPRRE